MMATQQALLLVDLQNDFCAGGALAVERGDEVIAVANQYAAEFIQRHQPVIATLDWHPADHGSFASVAGKPAWTTGELAGLPHCIQNSIGAAFHPGLKQGAITDRICKGQDPQIDSYSGFFDNGHRYKTGLDAVLRAKGITALTVMGLATDYCVKYTVLDALTLGYTVTVITAGCRAVNLSPGDSEKAFQEMAAKGAIIL